MQTHWFWRARTPKTSTTRRGVGGGRRRHAARRCYTILIWLAKHANTRKHNNDAGAHFAHAPSPPPQKYAHPCVKTDAERVAVVSSGAAVPCRVSACVLFIPNVRHRVLARELDALRRGPGVGRGNEQLRCLSAADKQAKLSVRAHSARMFVCTRRPHATRCSSLAYDDVT